MSASRLESVAILRLRLCTLDVVSATIQPAYFHFIKHAGMFHYWLEDIPHAVVGVAQLELMVNDTGASSSSQENKTWLDSYFGIAPETLTWIQVVFSLASVVFGVIHRSMQQLVLSPATARNSVRDGSGGSGVGLRRSLLSIRSVVEPGVSTAALSGAE